MRNTVQVRYRDAIFEVEAKQPLLEVLEKLGIEPETVLAIREGEMIGGEAMLEEGDEVRLVGVISGGGKGVDRRNDLAV